TGVTPPVWSPERCPGGGQTDPGTTIAVSFGHAGLGRHSGPEGMSSWGKRLCVPGAHSRVSPRFRGVPEDPVRECATASGYGKHVCHRRSVTQPYWGGRRIGVVKRSAVGTGPLRRSPAVHSQPIDLVVFQEPS